MSLFHIILGFMDASHGEAKANFAELVEALPMNQQILRYTTKLIVSIYFKKRDCRMKDIWKDWTLHPPAAIYNFALLPLAMASLSNSLSGSP
jgi:hypothetical protein